MEIWTEKYRPKKLDDVTGHKDIIPRLKAFVKEGNMPHLMFAGPAGTGKTTCALCLANEIFGNEWKANFLELNASDERGIDIIRNKVKEFARTMTLGQSPFKIILLDEADALTPEAQQALRRTMEKFTKTCRFILNCNYSSKLIDPIQSRCAVFRFRLLEKDEVKEFIGKVAKLESLNPAPSFYDAIYSVSRGDLRRSLNIMQSCAVIDKNLTDEAVFKVAGFARPEQLKTVIQSALNGRIIEARNGLFDVMNFYGLSGLDIVKQISSFIWEMEISDELKVRIIEKLGEFEFRMVEGSDEVVQLESFLAQLGVVK